MTANLNITRALALTAAGLFAGTAAQACDLQSGGFLAAVVECAAPDLAPVARAADRLNGQLGNPVDHAAARMASGIVPGSGELLEAGWAQQRAGGGRPSGRVPQSVGQSIQQVNFPIAGGWNSAPPMPQPMPMPMLGARCATPAGVFGPGMVQPVGAPCFANTPYGAVAGQIIM